MARYTGSRTKLSKRVGKNLFLKGSRSFSAKDDYTKKPYKAGMHGGPNLRRPAKVSEYGKQLMEKQNLRYTYGLMEKQLSNLFKKSFKMKGDTGLLVLEMLERRLDNVVYKAGLANSLAQARQLVNHGHFDVNGVKCDIPSAVVKQGDEIKVRTNKLKSAFWTNYNLQVPLTVPNWIDASKKMSINIITLPLTTDLPITINIAPIVEYYSRKVA
jgi:small subunit ribosomal protein S4